MINNNLGTLEETQKLEVNKLVEAVRQQVWDDFLKATIKAGKSDINLTTSRTGQGGTRYWFKCPRCNKRVGSLYRSINDTFDCRSCTGAQYKKQRFKGMTEDVETY